MSRYKEPCSICENWIKGVECSQSKCPVYKMKQENQRLRKEVADLKAELSQMESDAGWDFENRCRNRTYEMGEC